jgi:alanyl-tRNA synthetase/REP element-mobilizing transposase RayT
MMTSTQIRQSFLDFFKSKQHTIVPSSSLMPDSPNLLFTNAGMNQFVPIFLGQVKCPYSPGRAADTQKCIRAGGKHNDLDDVGLDTYHHTFFEMLGNWSFGDYFKKEAIEWAWELVVGIWKFPPQRLYATVYNPDKSKNDPSEFDQEAWNFWAEKFRSVGLDPAVHIVNGNKRDNFWMMGDTGPCGPCSELHVDLTPDGDTRGALVNKGDARCIEIWNLVFIQFNANPDGSFSPLPAKHVDTGMGFERVTSIIQGTKEFTDFKNAKISNYETDIFRPIFDALEKLSGKKYTSTLPQSAGIATVSVAPVGVPPTGPTRATNPIAQSTSHPPEAAARDAQQGDRDGRDPQRTGAPQAAYYKRRLPHFERPWAKYMVTFSTREKHQLSPTARDIVLNSLLFGHEQRRYQMYAACVMPDHVHFLFEPQIKEQDKDGKPVFWPLTELLHSIKSFTAHEINKVEKTTGQVWENESFDRLIRGNSDLEEKFHYICRNPWDNGVIPATEPYRWLWTPDAAEEEKRERAAQGIATVPVASVGVPPTDSSREGAASSQRHSTSHAPGAVARDAQQGDRDGRDPQALASAEQVQIDIAFRVIADHIRTLSFAIADGIQPGNNDRNYVLRRILRRAVRYGRTLGFHEPFFYKLVDVLAQTMGDVFPEIRTRQAQVQETIRIEEEAFNKTLDRGIELFNDEAAKLLGTAPAPGAVSRALAGNREASDNRGAKYSKRHLPHFERPWGKYTVTFSTREKRQLTPAERDIVLQSVLYAHEHRQYQLFAACVMPDHVHLLFEPQIKEQDKEGNPVFFSLGELLHGIKSTTAHRINKAANVKGVHVWEEESFDRLMRGDADLEEKFHYICRNPWDNGVVPSTENYRWLWTPEAGSAPAPGAVPRALAENTEASADPNVPGQSAAPDVSREGAGNDARGGRAPQISGAFAFRLYDEQGFPLDLTELMARERGLSVDTAGFEKLMDEQRARARAAQKKEVISLSQIETTTPTHFLGYDHNHTGADVQEVVALKDKTAVVLNNSVCYAEMGGQVGDTGELTGSGQLWRVTNTQKSGNTWLHFIEGGDAPAPGQHVTLQYDAARRNAIQRHHTVTHLLHWALHEVASQEASQKGSFVGPDKLTFDFNSAPLTPAQVADIEKLVNERILENAPVSWTEVPHADVKNRKDVMQFFGDKYGDVVRVVQVGGKAGELNGYSMELCGGTHTRATGEIGLFRIVGENAIAAGVRRIEAVAGLTAYDLANQQLHLIRNIAGKINSPVHELEKKVEALLAQQKELEKQVRTAMQRNASNAASELIGSAKTVNGVPLITHNLGDAEGDFLQAIADSLKGRFKGVVVLGGGSNDAVSLIATVSAEFTAKIQAGKIIQTIAPIVGGKGGGKPDNARGGGKDASKLDEALSKAAALL